jgi:hypothetical protein
MNFNWRLGETFGLHFEGHACNQHEEGSNAEDKDYVISKRRLTLTGLCSVASQKREIFIATCLKTSNPKTE